MAKTKNRNQARAQNSQKKHAKMAERKKALRLSRHLEKQLASSTKNIPSKVTKLKIRATRGEDIQPVQPVSQNNQEQKQHLEGGAPVLHNKSKIPFEVVIDGRRAVEKSESVASTTDLSASLGGVVKQVFANKVEQESEQQEQQIKETKKTKQVSEAKQTKKSSDSKQTTSKTKSKASKSATKELALSVPPELSFQTLSGKFNVKKAFKDLELLQQTQPSAVKYDEKFFVLKDKLPAYGRSKFASRNAEYKLKAPTDNLPTKTKAAKAKEATQIWDGTSPLVAPALGGIVGLGLSYRAKSNQILMCHELAVSSDYDKLYNQLYAGLLKVSANNKQEIENAKEILQHVPGFDFKLVDLALEYMKELCTAGKSNLALLVEAVQYLAGVRKYFSALLIYYLVSLFDEFKVEGFKRIVLLSLLNINYAEETNYDQLANTAGYANVSASTKTSLMSNPFPLFFPCHRVSLKYKTKNEDGTVNSGGYVLGTDLKNKLLELEEQTVEKLLNVAKYDVWQQAWKMCQ